MQRVFKDRLRDLLNPRKGLIPLVFILLYFLFAFWYVEAGNFSYEGMVGVYTYQNGAVVAEVQLLSDHTYKESLKINGIQRETIGTWLLFPSDSQSDIAFSKGFLALPDEQLHDDGIAVGHLENRFGFRSIFLISTNSDLAFRKKVFTSHL